MYKYLNFFNKKGEYCNFQYFPTSDKWVGRIDFNTVSEGLIEDYQLYIMEEVYNSSESQYEFTYPIKNSALGATFNGAFNPTRPIPEIFLYNFDPTQVTSVLTKSYNQTYLFDTTSYSTGTSGIKTDIKEVTTTEAKALQINIGFSPSSEDGFTDILYLVDSNDHVFAELMLYGEGEEEDERLRDYLAALGCDLLPQDEMIFDQSDVNEIKTDWNLLNLKRKELLLEYSNIYPYLGSYKALINVIKFFGYQNLRMKEYWLNIDTESPSYNKFKQIDISEVFSEDANFNNLSLIPSKVYKKTNKFGLYYDITVESGEYDDDGIPIAEEVFQFSPQEILIKIYALKKKLQNVFLPVNARIVDIIGEAVYFGKYDINYWNDQYRIDDVSLGLKPKYTVLPSKEEFIQDLRYMYYFGAPVGKDLKIGGYTDILSWQIGIANIDTDVSGPLLNVIQTYRLNVTTPTYTVMLDTVIERDIDTGQVIYKNYEVANKIINKWRSNTTLNNDFIVYQEGGTSGVIRILQKTGFGDGYIIADWFSNSASGSVNQYSIPGPTGGTSSSINVSPGPSGTFGPTGAPISYFEDVFLGYFDRANVGVRDLNDDEDIPVGAPFVLRNDTFNITWDDANVTYNQIDETGATGQLLFGNFTISKTIGWTSIYPNAGIVNGENPDISIPVGSTVSGFPVLDYPSPGSYNWNNLGYYGYYEMQWIVEKEADDTPAFYLDSGVKPITEINAYPIILPYVGDYKVSLYMWDSYNTKSFIMTDNVIKVKLKDSDFIGWYNYKDRIYNLDSKRKYVQKKSVPKPFDPRPSEYLTWDEYASTWDLPFHPNEEIDMAEMSYGSLDSAEFYKTIKNPVSNPLVDRYPYTFELITDLPSWDDLYHLWWDSIGTRITQWEIEDITGVGSTVDIFMTRENSTINIDSVNVTYVAGPVGFTGATASYASGSIGDIIVSNANRRTYKWNGNDWVYVKDIIDSYRPTSLTGTTREKLLQIVDQLNKVMPNDGVDHPYLKDFIYYYEEKYDNVSNLIPYIRAVSKDFDKGGRHRIKYLDLLGSTASYETTYFGYLGDIPTSFEIYSVPNAGPTGSIQLNDMLDPYVIGATNLIDLNNELNNIDPSYNKLGEFTYNIVYGTTGASASGTPYPVKIQAVSKAFKNPETIEVTYTDGIIGTTYGRSLIKNPSWDGIRTLKYTQELPLCTVVNFTYDNSKINGKKNPIWKLTKEGDVDFNDIYYNNKYFSYMFNEKGSYTISLQIEDTNGNTKEVIKQEIIKII